jgi:CubicO group peptidase (beta-lactamase class C family)
MPSTRPLLSILSVLVVVAGCAGSQPAVERADRLERARAYSAETSGDALLVWVDGALVLEDYPHGYDPAEPHILAEASTLLTNLAVLAAVDDGALALDERAAATLTAWQNDSLKAAITIRQLLQMTSGLDADRRSGDLTVDDALAAPMAHAPGAGFRFGPAPVQVLGAILRRTSDDSYLARILRALEIPGARWLAVSASAEANAARGAALTARRLDGAHLTPREWGRIGQVLLQDGRWEGEVLIDDLAPLSQPSDVQPAYGMGVWRNAPMDSVGTDVFNQLPESLMLPRAGDRFIYDGAPTSLYMAAGRYNQRLYVIPSKQMVVVRMGRANLTWSDAAFLARLLNGRAPEPMEAGEPSVGE